MLECIRVSVSYADPQRHLERTVELPAGCCVDDALRRSGLLGALPGFVPAGIGIFGKHVARDAPLRDGDRVELYRPLQCDPKTARRKRADR
jgi:putative ubiquitin-RnfH superfamily antitoxin RatB of RatAB toxin-antitoxin module